MKARRCFSLVLLAGLLAVTPSAQTFAAEPGKTARRVVPPRSDAAFPLRPPKSSAESRQLGHDGIVSFLVLVDIDGRVVDQRVTASSGHAELDAAALKATKRWKLVPGTINGVPTKMWGHFSITFSVEGQPKPVPEERHLAAQKLVEEFMEKMEAAAAAAGDAQGQQSINE